MGSGDRAGPRLRRVARLHLPAAAGDRHLVRGRRADRRERHRLLADLDRRLRGRGIRRLAVLLDRASLQGRGCACLAAVAISRPDPRGHAFFERWGLAGVFIGRFFGPLRRRSRWSPASARCRACRSRSPMSHRRWSGPPAFSRLGPSGCAGCRTGCDARRADPQSRIGDRSAGRRSAHASTRG